MSKDVRSLCFSIPCILIVLLCLSAPRHAQAKQPEGYRLELAYDLPKTEALRLRDIFLQEGFNASIGEKNGSAGSYRVSLGTFSRSETARQLAEGIGSRLTLSTSVVPRASCQAKYPAPKILGSYWTLQIGTFSIKKNALAYRDHWHSLGYPYYVVRIVDKKDRLWWCTRIGLFPDKQSAERTARLFVQEQGQPLLPLTINHALLIDRVVDAMPDIMLADMQPHDGRTSGVQWADKPTAEHVKTRLAAERVDGLPLPGGNAETGKKTDAETVGTEPPPPSAVPRKKTTMEIALRPEEDAVQTQGASNGEAQLKTQAREDTAECDAIPESFWTLHIGAFSIEKNALDYRDHWRGKGYPFYVVLLRGNDGKAWWMPRMGIYPSKSAARKAGQDFRKREGKELELRSMQRGLYKKRLVQ